MPVLYVYAFSVAYTHTLNLSVAPAVLCAAWLFLQRRLSAHLPHWRVLRWRLCAECFVRPCDGLSHFGD